MGQQWHNARLSKFQAGRHRFARNGDTALHATATPVHIKLHADRTHVATAATAGWGWGEAGAAAGWGWGAAGAAAGWGWEAGWAVVHVLGWAAKTPAARSCTAWAGVGSPQQKLSSCSYRRILFAGAVKLHHSSNRACRLRGAPVIDHSPRGWPITCPLRIRADEVAGSKVAAHVVCQLR